MPPIIHDLITPLNDLVHDLTVLIHDLVDLLNDFINDLPVLIHGLLDLLNDLIHDLINGLINDLSISSFDRSFET